MVRTILQNATYKVVTATNGPDGVALASQIRPDLIVMDGVMPGLDGVEAVRQLRRQEATGSIPILMLTGRDDVEFIKAAHKSGCSDYVIKPVNGAELITKVRSLLEES